MSFHFTLIDFIIRVCVCVVSFRCQFSLFNPRTKPRKNMPPSVSHPHCCVLFCLGHYFLLVSLSTSSWLCLFYAQLSAITSLAVVVVYIPKLGREERKWEGAGITCSDDILILCNIHGPCEIASFCSKRPQ